MADRRIELYIETLTGTAFELQVSPLETIMSIKAKIQHLEGIPISQQHLIWKTEELDNGCCLEDYNITDGTTLKLVLGMRGGPLNTRMYTAEQHPSLSTMAEYLERATGEELSENRPLTVVVFHDGEQVHWYTVIDEADRSSSTTHSRSESSTSSTMDGRDVELSNEQLIENQKMRLKMSALQKRFQNLGFKRKSKRKPFLPPLHVQGSTLFGEGKHRRRRESVDKLPSISSANILETRTPRPGPPLRLPLPPSSCCSSPGEPFPTPTIFSPSYGGRTRVLPEIPRSFRGPAASRVPHDSCRFSSQAGTPSKQLLPEFEIWLRNRPKTTPDKWNVYRPFSSSLRKSVYNVGGSNSSFGGTNNLKTPSPTRSIGLGAIVAAGLKGLRSSRKKKEAEIAHQEENGSNTKLPPVQVKKKAKRCNWCNKKTGLASTYICRCGKSFCATHRYPEAHRCPHDFKTEGRKALEKSNPVITAPKLPKI